MTRKCTPFGPFAVSGAKSPRVVFFDVGQTLVKSPCPSARRFIGSLLGLCEKEIKAVGKLIMTYPAYNPRELIEPLRALLPTRSSSEIHAALNIVWRSQTEGTEPVGGACSLLSALKAEGIRIGVISNMWHPFFEGILRSFGALTHWVDHWVLSYRASCKKPSLEIFREAMRKAEVGAEECWMVGDSYELDVEPAREVGMQGIWVLSGPEREPDILAGILRGEYSGPDWAVKDLQELERHWLYGRSRR